MVCGLGFSLEARQSDLISGLKEALAIGTKNAVQLVSQVDGYFGNEVIKILLPDEIRSVADTLSTIGFRKQVDEFVMSMNRAAERAAPEAAAIFGEAIKEMTFEDAQAILGGGDTAATEYFQEKTSERIYEAFKPIVTSSMEEVGVTSTFTTMMDKYGTLPLVEKKTVDLDHYVTDKAMAGLFHMVGEEEKKIRTDPAARVTDILKTVFK
jgi:hypothetical protein